MSQVSRAKISPKTQKVIFEIFMEALIETKNKTQAKKFIDEFFTPTEKIMLAKRFAIGLLLYKGLKVEEIMDCLKVSISTVSRVNSHLKYGKGGYLGILKRVERKRKLKIILKDIFKSIQYDTILPPRGRNWKEWAKEKREWKEELRQPLR